MSAERDRMIATEEYQTGWTEGWDAALKWADQLYEGQDVEVPEPGSAVSS